MEQFKTNKENMEQENRNLEQIVNHTKRSHEIKIAVLKDKERSDNVRMERQMHSRMKVISDESQRSQTEKNWDILKKIILM